MTIKIAFRGLAEVIENGKRIGEEGAVAGGEGGDDVADILVDDGRPRGGANLAPEIVLCGEGVELGGSAGGGGESGAVEAREDVGLHNVLMDGGDVIIDGDCR